MSSSYLFCSSYSSWEHPLSNKWNLELLEADTTTAEALVDKIIASCDGLFMPERENIPLRPILLTSELLQELTVTSKRLVELCEEATYLMSDGEPLKLRKDFGVASESDPLFSNKPLARRLAGQIARPDFLISRGQIKFLEMNIHSAIGGLQTCSTLPQVYLNSPVARKLRKSECMYTETPLAEFSRLLNSIRDELGCGADYTVGFFEWEYDIDETQWLISLIRAYGINAVHVNPDDMEIHKDGYIYSNGIRIDVGLRLFSLNSLEFPDDVPHTELLMQGHKVGGTLMLPCETASLYSNKKVLAFLSENARLFPQEDQKVIETYLPWTRALVTNSLQHPQKGTIDFEALKSSEMQKQLVLKPGDGEQGENVYIGIEMDNNTWVAALDKAFAQKTWVIQEYYPPDVVNLPFYNPANKKVQIDPCTAIFGTYVLGRNGGHGVLTRIGRGREQKGVLNYARGAIVSSALFA